MAGGRAIGIPQLRDLAGKLQIQKVGAWGTRRLLGPRDAGFLSARVSYGIPECCPCLREHRDLSAPISVEAFRGLNKKWDRFTVPRLSWIQRRNTTLPNFRGLAFNVPGRRYLAAVSVNTLRLSEFAVDIPKRRH